MIVRRPVAGTVTGRAAAAGAIVNDLTVPRLTLSTPEIVRAPGSDNAFVAKDQKVDAPVPAYPGETWKRTVTFIGAILDPPPVIGASGLGPYMIIHRVEDRR